MFNVSNLFSLVELVSDIINISAKQYTKSKHNLKGRSYYDKKSGLVQIYSSQTHTKQPRTYCASPISMQNPDNNMPNNC